jgi:hypothetical protein
MKIMLAKQAIGKLKNSIQQLKSDTVRVQPINMSFKEKPESKGNERKDLVHDFKNDVDLANSLYSNFHNKTNLHSVEEVNIGVKISLLNKMV